MSPRTILSPSFAGQPQLDFPTSPRLLSPPLTSMVKQQSFQKSHPIAVPQLLPDADEIEILKQIGIAWPDGIGVHTAGQHPSPARAVTLQHKGRIAFEPAEELRLINDVLFEGVLGLPGFLAWTAVPLALAHYGKAWTVDYMAQQLLEYGDIVTQMFAVNTDKRFLLKPAQLQKWYADAFEAKSIHERLFNALKLPGSDRVTLSDLQRVSQILLKLHPGLGFLADAPQFQTLYAQTVAFRILFENDSNFKGYLLMRDLKKIQTEKGTEYSPDNNTKQGGLLEALWQSQYEQDINKNLKCFSYEHFYVFYVTFWELDQDRDKQLSVYDLERYAAGSVSKLAIQKAFELLVQIRLRQQPLYEYLYIEKNQKKPSAAELQTFLEQQVLYYPDFIRFLIYLENPDLDVSVDFWFEIADVDADGFISLSDFKQFFGHIRERMDATGAEIVDAPDIYCQMIDFYKATRTGDDELGAISLRDIRQSKARGNLFSTMFHFQRFQQFDMKDPYTIKNFAILEKTLWERFCRRQYDVQVQGVQGDGY